MEIAMNILLMLGGVAVFMFGMKQMSSGLEQSAGSGIRRLFKKIDKNRMVNYGIGIGATALVQSSSASSIMTVGLAHAKIVTIKQGAGFILGAKVGTTLTAFIFALSGISSGFSISAVFASIAFIGVMIVFSTHNEFLNKLAPFLIGFGLLFVGLEVIEIAIGGADSALSIQLSTLFKYEVMQNPFLLLILGILFTAIIQSSTAATGVFIVFLTTGVIANSDQAFFLLIGANIGTCSDAIMASLTTNANGKRIAIFHLLTSVIGGVLFSIILMIFRTPITKLFGTLFPTNPQFSLVTFNLIYNLLYTLLLLLILDPLVTLVTKIVKEKTSELEELLYIEERFLKTPAVALEQGLKELYHMTELAKENLDRSFHALIHEDLSESKRLADVEYQIDFLTAKITSFFIKISSVTKFEGDEKMIGALHHVTNDVERLGDYAVLIIKEANYMKNNEVQFLAQTKEELTLIYDNISLLYNLGYETFVKRATEHFSEVYRIHNEINALISQTRDDHVIRLNSGKYPVEISKSIYSVLFSFQRIADHIVNIAFSIRSTTGSKVEAMKKFEKEKKQ